MSHICRFTQRASLDLEAIIDYVAEQADLDVAERLLDKVNQICMRIAAFPGMGKRRDELALNIRSFPVESYLIFYQPIEEGVEVIRIVSGYRDLEALFVDDE